MPKGKARIIHCRTCNKVIMGKKPYKKSFPLIMKKVRSHYKRHHPKKFKEMTRKAQRTKKKGKK